MLNDLRILDLSRVLAGPYCTMLLADLGAEVIKVEPPGGDDTRRWGPPFVGGESAYFLSVNRNKRSVVVDLKKEGGPALVRELAGRADVLVENFKTGDLARYGLDYASLRSRYPRLIYASITGFGQTGPRAREPGYDGAIQSLSGLMAMTGEPGGGPVKLPVAWTDVLTGVHAATAVLAALHERSASGRGRHLDLALLDVTLASLVNQAQNVLLTGEAPRRHGSAHPSIVPYQAFSARDGALTVAVGTDAQFARLCGALGLDDVAADARYRTNAGRVEHRDELTRRLQEALGTDTRAAWLERLAAAGVPATPVNTLAEALADPQVAARGVIREAQHPTVGVLPLIGSPFGTPARVEPPPLLGQHTREVLSRLLGLAPDEIDALEADGVVGAP